MTKKKDRNILSELCGDAYFERSDKITVLAAALDFVSRGTKNRDDCIEIIRGCCPSYFQENDSEAFDHFYDNIKNDIK